METEITTGVCLKLKENSKNPIYSVDSTVAHYEFDEKYPEGREFNYNNCPLSRVDVLTMRTILAGDVVIVKDKLVLATEVASVLAEKKDLAKKKALLGAKKKVDEDELKKISVNSSGESLGVLATLGVLAKSATVSFRSLVNEKQNTVKSDQLRYLEATGEKMEGDFYSISEQPKMRGTRAIFDIETDIDKNKLFAPLNMDGETYKDKKGGVTLHHVSWFWTLVEEYGFRLGKQDVELIKPKLESEDVAEFLIGYNKEK